ncbi:malto-oligosyltrehalose trehalohydrolase [Burkholderia ubonensis]|uniref:malto-oligosyltrehalose trehalohydrolase n=1 Tax=Burkholderia ubonensis TaxID=101571 RepID=UPI00075514C6|nr:malto-oligosyltrehalose trehalohydrolase [Burkholderia ubonensis]KVC64384.1 malto-oligosyltrehalose trehalohydrolase [Burkholderia ubonensis]KVD87019.1 malto-oligosyltrehalose trehalohydrolase [Burkholderia ubonensis]
MTTRTYRHPLSFGAAPQADGTTRFRLWAPSHPVVMLAVEGQARVPMTAQADGWHEAVLACAAGARYRYVLADGTALADPASRAQDGGPHDASIVCDAGAFRWRHTAWRGRPWHETVLYELHAGALGGYAGVAAQLPRLAALGVTAIELMPIATFGGTRNWGYDGVLPFAPSAAYGSPDALKSLIDDAHGLGLMVFLDVVYNHFGPDGNVMGRLAAPFFDASRRTPWGDAIDFSRPAVREFFIENALYWLFEYRFDGLRLDAVHAIGDTSFLVELARRVRAETTRREPDRHIHLVLENEDNRASLLAHDFTAQWNDDAHNAIHVLLTGEHDGYYRDFAKAPTARLACCLADGFAFQGERVARLGRLRGEPSAWLPTTAFVMFLQNHDQVGNRAHGERLTALCDAQALRAAVALLLLSPQIPLLFMGEEWGCTQPFLYFTDYHDALADAVREGRRTEFAHQRAFADPAARAAIPDPNDVGTFTRSCPAPNDASQPAHAAWLAWYRTLLAMRRAMLVPRLPGTRALGAEVISAGAVRARWRMNDGAALTLYVNLHRQSAGCTAMPAGTTLCSTPDDAAKRLAAGELAPASCVAWLEAPP